MADFDPLKYQEDLPTAPILRGQLSAAIEDWTERNKLIKQMRDALTGRTPIQAPSATQYKVQVVHSYYMLAALNEKAARFLDRPSIAVVSNAATDEISQVGKDRDSRIEKWLNAAFMQLDKNSGMSVWGAITRDAIAFDIGVERIERAPAAFWPDLVADGDGKNKLMRIFEDSDEYEQNKDVYLKRAGIPIRSVYVPPDFYLPLYDGPTPVQEFQIEHRSLRSVLSNKMFDTRRLQGMSGGSMGNDGGVRTRVSILHVVNGQYHAYYALAPNASGGFNTWPKADTPQSTSIGEPIFLYAYKHGLSRSPYNAIAGRFSGYRNQDDWIEGAVLKALNDLNMDVDNLLSQAATYHRGVSWPSTVAYYDHELRGADEGLPKPPAIQEGQPIAMWTSERIGSLYEIRPNPMFESLYEKYTSRINELSGSAALFGIRNEGVDTGFHQQLQISQSEHLDEKIEEHFAFGAVARAEILLEHVRKLEEKVYVTPVSKDNKGRFYGTPISISAKDLAVLPPMAAKVRGTSPLNVAANLRAVLDATQVRPGHGTPLYPDGVALEKFMGEEAPDEIEALKNIQRERSKLLEGGILTTQIARKLNMMLASDGAPSVTPEMAANADPALLGAVGEIAKSGITETAGGINPGIMSALLPTGALGNAAGEGLGREGSPFTGRGGGPSPGQPQPEQQAGLMTNRVGPNFG